MFILEIHLIGHEKQTYFLYKPLLNISKCLLNMVTWVTKYCTTYQKVFNIFLFNIIKIPSFDVLLHKYWSFRFAWSEGGFNLHFLYNLAISRFFMKCPIYWFCRTIFFLKIQNICMIERTNSNVLLLINRFSICFLFLVSGRGLMTRYQ